MRALAVNNMGSTNSKILDEVKELFDRGFLEPSNFVYHYTPRNTAIEHILSSMSLRLGLYDALNDPWEYQKLRFQMVHPAGEGPKDLSRILSEYSRNIKYGCRILCTTMDLPTNLNSIYFEDPTYNLPCSPGAYQFYRGYGHPRMWAQYAENHSGVCLMLNKENLHKEILNVAINERLYSGSVIYDNSLDRHDGDSIFSIQYKDIKNLSLNTAINMYIEKHHKRLYFQKSTDWRDEHEYRWVVRGENNEPLFVPINGCLEAVIVGQRFPDVYLTALYPFAEEYNIKVIKCFWFNGEPSLFPDLKAPH